MKRLALVLAGFALASAAVVGAGAQQQTFYSVKAGPKIPPTHSPEPVNYIYYGCSGHKSSGRPAPRASGRATSRVGNGNPCGSQAKRPSPRPRHT